MTAKIPLHIAISGHNTAFSLGVIKEILRSNLFELRQVYTVGISSIIAPFIVTNKIDMILGYILHSRRLRRYISLA